MIDAGRTSVLQVAEVAWNSVRRERQFRPVSGTRDAVGKARDALGDRFDITAEAALSLLERLAAQCGTSLEQVSRQLIGGPSTVRRAPRNLAPPVAHDDKAELHRRLIREATRC